MVTVEGKVQPAHTPREAKAGSTEIMFENIPRTMISPGLDCLIASVLEMGGYKA